MESAGLRYALRRRHVGGGGECGNVLCVAWKTLVMWGGECGNTMCVAWKTLELWWRERGDKVRGEEESRAVVVRAQIQAAYRVRLSVCVGDSAKISLCFTGYSPDLDELKS